MVIVKYIDFINELVVTSYRSASGSTRESDIILDDPSNNKTLSSKILLNKKLKEEEEDSNIDEMPKGLRKEIQRVYKKYPAISVSINNLQFLKNKLDEKGILKCEYCNRGPLIVYDIFFERGEESKYIKYSKFKPIDGATCDHKNPLSKGGDKINYENLAVCCSRCNTKKGNMKFDDWLKYMSDHKSEFNARISESKSVGIRNEIFISDVFLDVSDKYKIKETKKVAGEHGWLTTYHKDGFFRGRLMNHFTLSNYGTNTWLMRIYLRTDNISEFEKDLNSFKEKLKKFGFRSDRFLGTKEELEIYGDAYIDCFQIIKENNDYKV